MIEDPMPFESFISAVQDLTFDTAAGIFADAKVEFGKNQMRTLGFFDGELYTNLAYLISDQCTTGIKLAAYSDEYKIEFLNRKEVCESVLSQAQRSMEFKRTRPNARDDTMRRASETALQQIRDREYFHELRGEVLMYGIAVRGKDVLGYGLDVNDWMYV